MYPVKMRPKGQMTLPIEVREALGIQDGDTFYVTEVDGKYTFTTAKDWVQETAGIFSEYAKNGPSLEPHQIRELANLYMAEHVVQSMKDENETE